MIPAELARILRRLGVGGHPSTGRNGSSCSGRVGECGETSVGGDPGGATAGPVVGEHDLRLGPSLLLIRADQAELGVQSGSATAEDFCEFLDVSAETFGQLPCQQLIAHRDRLVEVSSVSPATGRTEPVNQRFLHKSEFVAPIAEAGLDFRCFGEMLRRPFVVLLIAQHASPQDQVRLPRLVRLERGVQPRTNNPAW